MYYITLIKVFVLVNNVTRSVSDLLCNGSMWIPVITYCLFDVISLPFVFPVGGDEKREEEPTRLLVTYCELMHDITRHSCIRAETNTTFV